MRRDPIEEGAGEQDPESRWRKASLPRLAKALRVPLAELQQLEELVFDCIYHLGGPEIWDARGDWTDGQWSKAVDLVRFGFVEFINSQTRNEARTLYRSRLLAHDTAVQGQAYERPWMQDHSPSKGWPKKLFW